ncbi:MAG TPA: transposase [Rhabdochlamydiaceae bacterium]|jgi:putative transposase|nr:transposase [Rhabdochlamydiaceae bacterium]
MIIQRAFKFRLKPTVKYRGQFQQFAGARRWTFNHGLELRQKVYQAEGKTLSYYEQNIELTGLKDLPETSWLQEIHSQIPQQALKDLNQAYQHFFRRIKNKEKPGHPKFKKRGVRDSFRYPQGVKVEGSQAYLPKIGWVKFRKSREIQGKIKETTIVQEGNAWYIVFSCEIESDSPSIVPIDEAEAVGIDMGVAHFATTAAGKENIHQEIPHPHFLDTKLSKIKHLSRNVSRKTKGSKNKLKARIKLSKKHAEVKNLRTNFVQQLSTQMIKNHDIFCIESLDISNLLQKSTRRLARAISDAGWRSFLHCLKYKTEQCGKHLVEAGKYFPSSQICSSCGNRKEMPLNQREYHCQNCGLRIGRDYNSAIDLKAAGMSVLKPVELPHEGSLEAGISRL